jgi:hypothetical protein
MGYDNYEGENNTYQTLQLSCLLTQNRFALVAGL